MSTLVARIVLAALLPPTAAVVWLGCLFFVEESDTFSYPYRDEKILIFS
jgi:hypothetical protein